MVSRSLGVPLQVAAGDELEHEVRPAAVLTDLVERHNVRVVERGDDFGFEPQSAKVFFIRPQYIGPYRLQGDDAIEPLVPGFEDESHPAAGDLVEQLEFADLAIRRVFGLRCRPVDSVPFVGQSDTGALPCQPGQVLHSIFGREEGEQSIAQILFRSRNAGRSGEGPAWRYSAITASSRRLRRKVVELDSASDRTATAACRSPLTQFRASSSSRR